MQQAHVCRTFLALVIALGPTAQAKTSHTRSKPVEVLSDATGSGRPTSYTILNGGTTVRFTHPLLGQFSRAEITTRTQKGYLLTRFLLDRKTGNYKPVLRMLSPFEKLASFGPACDVPNQQTTLEGLANALDTKAEVKRTRDRLVAAGLFSDSCFKPKMDDANGEAILDGIAKVLTPSVQNFGSQPTFLQCMKQYGFADEAGTIEGRLKESIENKMANPKLNFCCQKRNENAADFNNESFAICLKARRSPTIEGFAALGLHELSHFAGIRDHSILQNIETCCTAGDRCNELAYLGNKRRENTNQTTIVEAILPDTSIVSSIRTVLQGEDVAQFSNSDLQKVESNFLFGKIPTAACSAMTDDRCLAMSTQAAKLAIDSFLTPLCQSHGRTSASRGGVIQSFLIPPATADGLPDCPGTVSNTHRRGASSIIDSTLAGPDGTRSRKHGTQTSTPAVATALQEEMDAQAAAEARAQDANRAQVYTAADLAERLPMTGPLDWKDVEGAQTDRGGLARDAGMRERDFFRDDRPVAASRSIASVAPLPRESDRSLGSKSNRSDVRSGRASVLVDTLTDAAGRVTAALTQTVLDEREVPYKKLLTANGITKHRPNAQYFVSSSLEKPLQVADISGLDLGFKNPFADAKSGAKATLAANTKAGERQPQADAANSPKQEARPPQDESVFTSTSAAEASDSSNANSTGNGGTTIRSGQSAAAAPRASHAATGAAHNPASTSTSSQGEGKDLLQRKLTQGYKSVEPLLKDSELKQELAETDTAIITKEGRTIGSCSAKTWFVYSQSLQRLTQSRRPANAVDASGKACPKSRP